MSSDSARSKCEREFIWIPDKHYVWLMAVTLTPVHLIDSPKLSKLSDELKMDETDYFECYPIPLDSIIQASIENIDSIVLEDMKMCRYLKKECHSVDPTHLMNPGECHDLCILNNLHEAPLLNLLRQRFLLQSAEIYTYTGNVLISINPYYNINGLYGDESIDKYLNHHYAGMDIDMYYGLENDSQKSLQLKKPHVYKIASDALKQLLVLSPNDSEPLGKSQSIIISGESGAGKTESSKHVINFMLRANSELVLQQEKTEDFIVPNNTDINGIMVKGGVILESFGNAKTVRNDNSSRFGKYIKLLYTRCSSKNTKYCMKLTSAQTETFLLEKSRVVSVGEGERNYHIFYEMLQGLAEHDTALFDSLWLTSKKGSNNDKSGDVFVTQFKILSYSGDSLLGNEADRINFTNTVQALLSVKVNASELQSIWTLLACILHLGNLTCEENESKPATIKSSTIPLDELSNLLGLETYQLTQSLTTQKLIIGDRKSIKVKILSTDEVRNNISALVKWLYNKLFNWIVQRINQSHESRQSRSNDNDVNFIGILDIFGFEVLGNNSFEQLCINFTNERLQQQFNEHVFITEQAYYRDEGLNWMEITFQDNQHVIDLISKRPNGLLVILETHGMLNRKPNDFALLTSFNHAHHLPSQSFFNTPPAGISPTKPKLSVSKINCNSPLMLTPPPPHLVADVSASDVGSVAYVKSRFSKSKFSVKHFAGEVTYSVEGFIVKNNDALQDDLIYLLNFSSNPFLVNIASTSASQNHNQGKAVDANFQRASVKMATASTVSSHFREQLDSLMSTLKETHPHYIKCIKPNSAKCSHFFDNDLIMRQLRYSGVLEVVRIRREGFPVRVGFLDFYNSYKVLLGMGKKSSIESNESARALVIEIAKKTLSSSSFQVGHSQIFLKDHCTQQLKIAIRQYFHKRAIVLQSYFRRVGYMRRRFLSKTAIFLQKNLRMCIRRRFMIKARQSVVRIRRFWKARKICIQLRDRIEAKRRHRITTPQRALSPTISQIVRTSTGGILSSTGGILRRMTSGMKFGKEPEKEKVFKRSICTSVPTMKDNDSAIIKVGWILKKRSGVMWQKRWLVLTADNLAYYHSTDMLRKPKFSIPLRGCTVQQVDGKEPTISVMSPFIIQRKNSFVSMGRRGSHGNTPCLPTLTLRAENEEDLQQWLLPLQAVAAVGSLQNGLRDCQSPVSIHTVNLADYSENRSPNVKGPEPSTGSKKDMSFELRLALECKI